MQAEDLILNQSCFDFLPSVADESVDLVLIDPPYEISRTTNFVTKGMDRFHVSTEFGEWDESFDGLDAVLKECFRILKESGSIICFHDIWKTGWLKSLMEDAGFKLIRFIEWLKNNPVPLNSHSTYLSNAREAAVSAVKGNSPTFNSVYDPGLYRYPICQDEGRFHPTQKPLALIRELVLKHSRPGDLVLDCFSGSGTTCAAALETGRRFTGCELSREYWEKSIQRVKASGCLQASGKGHIEDFF